MNSNPDLIVQHLRSIGFDVRLTGNEREVVFSARDADGKMHVVKGPTDRHIGAAVTLCSVP